MKTSAFADMLTSIMLEAEPGLREGYADVGDVRLHEVEAGEVRWSSPARLPRAVVSGGSSIRAARSGRLPGRRARPARLQPVVSRIRLRQAGRRHQRSDPRAWLQVADAGRPRLGRLRRLGDRHEPPGGGGPLAILDAATPRKLQNGLFNPRQFLRSWYFFFFALPWLPERIVRQLPVLQRFRARPAYSAEQMDRYVEAWSQPVAATGRIQHAPPPREGEGGDSADLGAHARHLGAARSLPRSKLAEPRTRAQPRRGASSACPTPPTRRGC